MMSNEALTSYMILTYVLVAILGLVIGSFLNVVIARYPKMLQAQWQSECRDFLGLKEEQEATKFTLAGPRSHCPHCKTKIPFYHNIPIFSYLWLRGKCAHCKRHISLVYPAVELLSCFASVIVLYHFGPSWEMLAALLFTYMLVALTFIDLEYQLLPDTLTLSTLWIGLMLNTWGMFTNMSDAIWSAVIGYLVLWISAWIFLHLRNKRGMGHGDFKMLAMVGAWFGINKMITALLIAVIAGTILSLIVLQMKRISWKQAIPFGPFIALGAWITMLAGPILVNWLRIY